MFIKKQVEFKVFRIHWNEEKINNLTNFKLIILSNLAYLYFPPFFQFMKASSG